MALALAGFASAANAAPVTDLAHLGPPAMPATSDGPVRQIAPARGQPFRPLAPGHGSSRGVAMTAVATPVNIASGFPAWNGSFQRNGINFPFTALGTDPHRGPATTVLKVMLIPLRFEYPDEALPIFGTTVFDASTDLVDGRLPIDGILKSPLFTPYPFTVGGVNVGTTQFNDAVQRASWWEELPPGKAYHVLLAPSVAPVQTVVVPLDAAYYSYDAIAGVNRPAVADDFLYATINTLIANLRVPSGVEPVFITGPVETLSAEGAHCCRGGLGLPYIWATYESSLQWGGLFPDVVPLSHELMEWINHPAGVNDVPGWPLIGLPTEFCYDRILEVGDPFEILPHFPAPTKDFTYHLADGAFIDWFSHRQPSRGAAGQYSFFGTAQGPSPSCVGDTVYQTTLVDVPGAYATVLNGINDGDDVVGYYFDNVVFAFHAFARQAGRFRDLLVPGSVYTQPAAINDIGEIAGYYGDGVTTHGFTLQAGRYQSVDVPGSVGTAVYNLNGWGDLVGEYVDAAGVLHGFLYRAGHFATIDAPGAANSAVTGINDHGNLTVLSADASGNVLGSFVLSAGSWRPVKFPGDTVYTIPGAIDDLGRVSGGFATAFWGSQDGFYTQIDGTYLRMPNAMVNGMNNRGQVAGSKDGHGFIGTVPPFAH